MTIMRRLTALFLALTVIATSLAAQSRNTVKMILKDALSGEPVAFATVSLTKEGEKKASKYVLSSDTGSAVIEKVAAGKYHFKAELLGYKTYEQAIEVKGALDLGEVQMQPDREMLNAASVTAAGNPIIMKKDTIEYNAGSFKTTDNDMLEDLLKKLPGVEVSEDGSVTANGKTINKITIDGKTFFLDDPQLATKNIPAKIINKVKVVDKKSEQAQFTGIDDGEEETVIDLSIMPGMMNGVFGNVMAGGGHDWKKSETGENINADISDSRYQTAAFVGKFTEKTQISLILNGNNTNNRGFNDLAGSMMQGMRGGGGGMGRGQGGFGGNNGISTSWMGGLNGNFTLFDDKMELGSNYLYNANKKHVTEQSVKATHMDGYDLIYNNDGFNNTNTYGNRFGARMEHKFSENTSLLFQPQFSIGKGDYHEYSTFDTQSDYFNGTLGKVNDGFNNNTGSNNSFSASGFLLLRQRLGKPGRTVSVNFRYSFSNNDMDGFNQSLKNTYDDAGNAIADITNQRFTQNRKQTSLSGRVTYTEPLGGNFYLEANYQLSWNKNTSDKSTYDSGNVSAFNVNQHDYNRNGETVNTYYSSSVLNRYYNQTIGGNIKYQKGDFNVQVGLSANPTDTHNETNGKVYNNKVVNWSPQAMMWMDLNENTNFRLFYFGRTSQPSTSQLMAVPDNTDPLNVSVGNPNLTPYFNHNIRSEFRLTNKKTFTSVNLNLQGSITSNPIVNTTWASSGTQFSLPVNGPDSYSGSARLFVNTPIARSNFTIFSMTMGSYSQSSSYIGKSNLDMTDYYNAEKGEFYYDKFFQRFPSIGSASEFAKNTTKNITLMERLRLTYRIDNLEITAGGRTRMNKGSYSYGNVASTKTWNNQLDGSVNITLPAGFGFVTDARYNWYNGYSTDPGSEVILNAQVSKLLFNNSVTLTLKAYDLLAQAKNLSVTNNANYHQEVVNNTLGRYVILSLTWRFGNFGNARKNARGPMGGRGPGAGGPPRF